MEKEVLTKLSEGPFIEWDLAKLYSSSDDPALINDLRYVILKKDELMKEFKGRIAAESIEACELRLVFEKIEEVMSKFAKPSMFAYLSHSVTPALPTIQKLIRKIDDLESQLESDLLFLKLELSKVSENYFSVLLDSPELANYCHYLELIRTNRVHLLSESEEKMLTLKELTGKRALLNLYDEFTSSFIYRLKIGEGEDEKNFTESEVETMRREEDPELRRKAFVSLFKKSEENSIVLTNVYNSLAKDWDLEAAKRGYSSPISMRNRENEIPDGAVQSLVDVTTNGYTLVQDYYRLKARILNKESLLHSDIYAPIGDFKDLFSWQEAKSMILEVTGNFDPRLKRTIAEFFEGNFIHGSIMPGKRSGAYCSYASPEIHPYVLLNFGGKMNDVLTLAHELGHGLHAVLSSKQTMLNYETPLTMAETASIFSEMLMTDHLLNTTSGREEKISFITGRIEEIFATTARQNMFTRFEIEAHKRISSEYLSFDELGELYFDELKHMFGETIDFLPESKYEWARIPHFFHTPFYCYAYNFAQLLVISLYRKYLEDGDVFKRKYVALLESGGSDSPEVLLGKAGIDISSPRFWENGIDFIQENFLDRLRAMI